MSLRKNTVWNLIGTGAPFLVGIFTIPFLIKGIGVESFGILTIVWALIGYFSLFDFGLGRALTQQVAANLAASHTDHISELVKSGLLFTLVTGLIGGVVLAVLSKPLGHEWLNVSQSLQEDTARCLLVAAIGIPLTTLTTGLRGVIEAYEDFKGINILRVLLGIANFGMPALSLIFIGTSLTAMVILLILARLIIMFAHIQLMNQKLPSGWFDVPASKEDVKKLLSFGAWMTVSNVISPLMVTADRFVISAILGAGFVAYYTVPFEVLIRVLILPAALTGALFPRLASLLASDPIAAHQLYRRCLSIVAAVLFPICLIIILGSYFGLKFWLGQDFAEHSWVIVCILSVGIFLNGVAFVPFAAIQAAGRAQVTARIHIFELVFYIPLLFLALRMFGLYGAAAVWVVRVGVDFSLLFLYSKRNLWG